MINQEDQNVLNDVLQYAWGHGVVVTELKYKGIIIEIKEAEVIGEVKNV